jgi:thiol-disulfide isomerase/thioredoxin
MIGKAAPPLSGTDIDGKPLRLAQLKGKVVLVDFWASWCPPSVLAFPHFRELALTRRDQGFTIIGVNLDALALDPSGKRSDPRQIRSTVRSFLLDHRASWPNVFGDDAEAIAKAYGVTELPASFLIGRDGVIAQMEQSGDALTQAIARALGD